MEINVPAATGFRYLPSFYHCCSHCDNVILDPVAAGGNHESREWTNTFSFTFEALATADRAHCRFVQQLKYWLSRWYRNFPPQWTAEPVLIVSFKVLRPSSEPYSINVKYVKWDKVMFAGGFKTVSWNEELVNLVITCEKDDVAASYVHTRPRYPYMISEATVQTIQNWTTACSIDHSCITPHTEEKSYTGPSRLVFLGQNNDPEDVKIVDVKKMDYIALSYCWGRNDSMILTHANLDMWKQSLPVQELPKTLRDSMAFARLLGIKHLWIDRLCIIQDDPEDMARELAVMPQIYSEAWLTLSVVSARDCQEGFLFSAEECHSSLPKSLLAMRLRCPDGILGWVTVTEKRDWEKPSREAIDERAWTMQENMLSPRVLRFSNRFIYWQCKNGHDTHYHDGTEPIRSQIWAYGQLTSRYAGLLSWSAIITDYSQRQLRFPQDKLPAISALAQFFARRNNCGAGEYLAGIWKQDLPRALLWTSTSTSSDNTRPANYRAPSWSWASVAGPITNYNANRFPHVFVATIRDISVIPASPLAPYGVVSSGYIKLFGRMIASYGEHRPTESRNRVAWAGLQGWLDVANDDDLPRNPDPKITRFLIYLFELGHNGQKPKHKFGLILVPATGKHRSADPQIKGPQLRRIGVFDYTQEERPWDVTPYSEVTIV